MEDIKRLSDISKQHSVLPSSFQSQLQDVSQMASSLPVIFNTLHARRAIIPAANGHCSARALARYYAALVDRGQIPPPHASSTQPRLGTHPHIPKFTPQEKSKKKQKEREDGGKDYTRIPTNDISIDTNSRSTGGLSENGRENVKLFSSDSRIHDAFMGVGEYGDLTLSGGQFGLGFKRSYSEDGNLIGFGHSGLGGSTGYCDIKNRFAIAVTLNKMNIGGVTAKVIQLVCSELNIPLPADFYRFTERLSDNESNVAMPLIN